MKINMYKQYKVWYNIPILNNKTRKECKYEKK